MRGNAQPTERDGIPGNPLPDRCPGLAWLRVAGPPIAIWSVLAVAGKTTAQITRRFRSTYWIVQVQHASMLAF